MPAVSVTGTAVPKAAWFSSAVTVTVSPSSGVSSTTLSVRVVGAEGRSSGVPYRNCVARPAVLRYFARMSTACWIPGDRPVAT